MDNEWTINGRLALFHDAHEKILRKLPVTSFNEMNPLLPAADQWRSFDKRRQAAQAFAAEARKQPPREQVSTVIAQLKQLNSHRIGPLESQLSRLTRSRWLLFVNRCCLIDFGSMCRWPIPTFQSIARHR